MDIDFSTDVEVWNDAREASEDLVDTCCLYSHSKEKDIMHDTFATILTKAQVRGRPEIDQVMQDEIKKSDTRMRNQNFLFCFDKCQIFLQMVLLISSTNLSPITLSHTSIIVSFAEKILFTFRMSMNT